ncbi:MAG: energy-coupling factor ABC transporter permease [Roseiflexus sp.]|nr:energy-coupling factor ABC transporter permease [Roseiflexus sp.]
MHFISHKPGAPWSLFGAELHIPDGFLNLPISLACWAIAIAIIALAARRAQRDLDERQAPLLGIMAAFIFAAQMINFPITGGTSGHLLGGVLAAVTLGPWGGILVMTAVIAIQALLFQDGGLLVMGANILNMGLITALIGYGLYRSVINQSQPVRLAVIGVAAWLSVMGAALATSLQLWLSGTTPLNIVIPAMMGVHALIGIGEALITVAAVAFIMRTRLEVMEKGTCPGAGRGWIIGGAIAALIVVLLSPLASADPDGLERVAEDMGFIDLGQSAPYEIIPDYTLPFLGETPLSTIVAGLIGVLVVAVVIVLVARALGSRRAEAGS